MQPNIQFINLLFVLVLSISVIVLLIILISRRANEKKKLEQMVQVRTDELNKHLQETEAALEMSKAVSKSKSVFQARMSNEIQTPLSHIIGFSEMALDEDAQKTKEYLGNIRKNADWMLQTINDILDISKIESGEMSLKKIPFDLHELFASCRTLIMPKAVEKGILLHFYAEPSVGKKPVGDPVRLRQIFINLLSNAVKFTNAGMVKLVSDIISIDDKSITIHFEIKDSGVGMTSEQIAVIFEPFLQPEVSMRKYGGTGLGLPITKSIIEMMGGKLFIDSTPGVGSRFSFDLTFDTLDASMDDISQNRNVMKDIEKPLFEGEVLICEDDFMKQEVIREHLTRVGLKTEIVENGLLGVEMVKRRVNKDEKLFDLILMDVHMPVMDGLEAAIEIIKLGVKTPIIALTANIMTDEIDTYKAQGISDCIGKPFTSQELWRCLLKYLTPVNGTESNKRIQIEAELEADLEFKKSLEKYFVKTNINKYEEICKSLEDGDIKQAHRLVHALKGNAGQIGKQALQSAAVTVELQLTNETNTVTPEHMAVLKNELDLVLTELKPRLNEDN
jgi:signal transduction histidine kinase/CheY-like chemotaxis protein